MDKEDWIAWGVFVSILIFVGCFKIGQDLTEIRKEIILQVGSLIFAILYGTFLNLWNSKDFFYRGLGRSTVLIYCFAVGALILYLGFYILIDKRFGEELFFLGAVWALIGFILLMPLVNALVLFTPPLRKRWHKREGDKPKTKKIEEDEKYLRWYRWGVLITSVIIYVIIPLIFKL